MKTLILLFSILAVQTTWNQTKNEQKAKSVNNHEYHQNKTVNAKPENNAKISETVIVEKDTILNYIQKKIKVALKDGFVKKNTKRLDELETFLESNKINNENLKNYWIAYINYFKTIISFTLKDEELGAKSNEKGIKLLEDNENKNSDDYALLVLLKGMSFAFNSFFNAPFISRDIKKYLKKGVEADDKNVRIYFAMGNNDFRKPKELGGGKNTESFLLKAINLPDKNEGNLQLPTWGKEEAYELLIDYYLKEGKKDKAKIYFEKATEIFPNNYNIQKLESKLTDQ